MQQNWNEMAVFFTFIEECCVVIEKNIDKKLANRISYQIRYKRCSKGKFGRGNPNLRRGSIPASGYRLGGGGPNPRIVQIRCDTGAKCPWFLVMTSISFRSVLAVPSVVLDGLISRGNLVKWLIWRERQDNGRANRCHQQWPLCMLLRGAIENFFFQSGWADLWWSPSALICSWFCWMWSPCCASSPTSLGKSIFGHTFDRVWR